MSRDPGTVPKFFFLIESKVGMKFFLWIFWLWYAIFQWIFLIVQVKSSQSQAEFENINKLSLVIVQKLVAIRENVTNSSIGAKWLNLWKLPESSHIPFMWTKKYSTLSYITYITCIYPFEISITTPVVSQSSLFWRGSMFLFPKPTNFNKYY